MPVPSATEVESITPPEDGKSIFTIKHKDSVAPVRAHVECFTEPKKLAMKDYRYRAMANEFDFGYAVTCHKFQGSQAESVLVYDDSFMWDEQMHRRWSYTSVTRAVDRVIYAR